MGAIRKEDAILVQDFVGKHHDGVHGSLKLTQSEFAPENEHDGL